MKILKAKIKVTHNNGGTQYEYPQVWIDNKEKINPIFYPNDRTDEAVDGVVGLHQIVYPNMPDELAAQMLVDFPEIFSAADRAEFETYTDKHYPVIDTITDQNAVLSVTAKAVLGNQLSVDEVAVLDPENSKPGVQKSKRMIDIALEHGATF